MNEEGYDIPYTRVNGSSWVEGFEYDFHEEVLTVETGKGSYAYKSVPFAVALELLTTYEKGRSVGEFVNEEIKKANYSYSKV